MKTTIRVIRVIKSNGQTLTHHADAVVESPERWGVAVFGGAEEERRAEEKRQSEITATAKSLFASFP